LGGAPRRLHGRLKDYSLGVKNIKMAYVERLNTPILAQGT